MRLSFTLCYVRSGKSGKKRGLTVHRRYKRFTSPSTLCSLRGVPHIKSSFTVKRHNLRPYQLQACGSARWTCAPTRMSKRGEACLWQRCPKEAARMERGSECVLISPWAMPATGRDVGDRFINARWTGKLGGKVRGPFRSVCPHTLTSLGSLETRSLSIS